MALFIAYAHAKNTPSNTLFTPQASRHLSMPITRRASALCLRVPHGNIRQSKTHHLEAVFASEKK